MEKFSTNNESEKYKSLKEDLLKGSISLEEVRDKLIEWDQSTFSRSASNKNLLFLHDPQIIEYIDQHPEAQESYHRLLSFTEFHVGQRLASTNSTGAIEYFRKSLENAQMWQLDENWEAYIQGTILYMEGKEIPEEIIKKVESSRNIQILRNFNEGLKERGSPSYMEDYSKF